MFLHNIGPIFFHIGGWAFTRGSIFGGNLLEKSAIFGIQTGEWTSIRAWASNRDFTVYKFTRTNNKITDEIAWMHWLICALVFGIQQKSFLRLGFINSKAVNIDPDKKILLA